MGAVEIKAPILRYHGGKWKVAPWVIAHFPTHRIYVEPYGGAAGVLCRKPISDAEVYNDLDGEIVNVFRVLRDPAAANRLIGLCRLTPYAREELELANEPCSDPVEQARRTLLRAWASFGSAGATRGRSGMRTYTKPGGRYSPVAKAWARVADAIPAVTARFREVVIENRPAMDVMAQHDTPETLHYVDPPYLPETRSFDGGRYYRHELTAEDHAELLAFLGALTGPVVVSGYPHPLYDEALSGWRKVTHETSGSSRFGGVLRTECLWISPRAAEALPQADLFGGDQ